MKVTTAVTIPEGKGSTRIADLRPIRTFLGRFFPAYKIFRRVRPYEGAYDVSQWATVEERYRERGYKRKPLQLAEDESHQFTLSTENTPRRKVKT